MELHGKSVFGGIAIGRISVHKKDEQQVKRVKKKNVLRMQKKKPKGSLVFFMKKQSGKSVKSMRQFLRCTR